MQRIHEEYGALFEKFAREAKQTVNLSPSALVHYGNVEWLNASEFLGWIEDSFDRRAMVFVFGQAVVFFCTEQVKKKANVEVIRHQVLLPVSDVRLQLYNPKDTPKEKEEKEAKNYQFRFK